MPGPRSLTWLGLAALAAIPGVYLFAGPLPSFDADAIAESVRSSGRLGPAALLAILVLQCVVAPLPSEPVMMAAGFVYGQGAGFLLSWLGVTIGAGACFGLARAFGRPFVERLVEPERLKRLDDYARARGRVSVFFMVLGLRLFAFMSFDVVSYGCGLVGFPFRWFLAATLLGGIPKAFAFSFLGASGAESSGWLGGLILVGTFGALLLLPLLARARASRTPAGGRSEGARMKQAGLKK